MSEPNEIRERQRQSWDAFAGGWTKWDALVQRMLGPVGAEMIRALELRDGGRHLDIASGTGEPGLSIAALVPHGQVVLTDLSGEMLAAASANVRARGLSNVDVRECSADDLPFDDESFDGVSCRFGFMFFPDIRGAVAELVRVLRPGGRISTAVWAEPAGNPWATIPMAAISSEVEIANPPPDAPGLFRYAAPNAIAQIFRDAGLRDVAETDVRGSIDPGSVEEYWSFMTEVAAPVVSGLVGADETARERIRTLTLENALTFEAGPRLSLPLHARCTVASK